VSISFTLPSPSLWTLWTSKNVKFRGSFSPKKTHPSRILLSEGKKFEKSQILLLPFPPKEKNTKNDKFFLSSFSRPFFL